MTGAFSLTQASLQVSGSWRRAESVLVSPSVWLATQVQKRLDDPPVQTMFSLLTPYVAYFCGEKLHVSGILAVVIAGYLLWLARTPYFERADATTERCRFGKWSRSF
jgi:NhaP-type Na+/H+ or K+/H+ antiporter